MASEWIKMRASLCTHPRVLMIARQLGNSAAASRIFVLDPSKKSNEIVTAVTLRDVTVAALLRVWSATNEHTEDGVWRNASLDTIDAVAGIPEFGLAMQTAGWAIVDEAANTVTMPNFLENNAPSKGRTALSNAERQAKFRAKSNEIRNEKVTARNVTVTGSRNEKVTVEKRREDIKEFRTPCGAGDSGESDPAIADAAMKLRKRLAGAKVSAASGPSSEERTSWLTPYSLAYEERQLMPLPVKPSLRALSAVRKKHGDELALAVWRHYCASEKGEFLTAARFSATFGTWLDSYHASTGENAGNRLLCVFSAYPPQRRGEQVDAIRLMAKHGLQEDKLEQSLIVLEQWKASKQWRENDGRFIPTFENWLAGRLFEVGPPDASTDESLPLWKRFGDTGENWHYGVFRCEKCGRAHHHRLEKCREPESAPKHSPEEQAEISRLAKARLQEIAEARRREQEAAKAEKLGSHAARIDAELEKLERDREAGLV